MPEFMREEADDYVLREILHDRYNALRLRMKSDDRTGTEALYREYFQLRDEIRAAGLNWPTAYLQPVEWGGRCVECNCGDGGHEPHCSALT